VKTALSAMTVKTDRKDARGIAQLLRMAWFQPVHAKSIGSQEIRALLVARKQLLGRLVDVELSIRPEGAGTIISVSRSRCRSAPT
jgi:transposase